MYTLFVIFHVLACLALILIVLLQTGKGADMGAMFGGSSQTVFGSQGAGGFLSKLTTGMAVMFMVTSLGLTYISSNRGESTVMESVEQPQKAGEPMQVEEATPPDAEPSVSSESGAAPAEEAASPETQPSEASGEPTGNNPDEAARESE